MSGNEEVELTLNEQEVMLTTTDNPFNPFTQFEEWYSFDEDLGYCTCGYLARIAKIAESLTPLEMSNEINNAIDEIVKLNPLGIYKKVTRDDYK